MFDENALFIQLPGIIKSRTEGDKRLVEIVASKEVVDREGDVILQRALLDAGHHFVQKGHLDRDHWSELGDRYPDELYRRFSTTRSSDLIVGTPLEVRDVGEGVTEVLGELRKGNPHADEIWDGLNAKPAVRWQASIYGYHIPGSILDARTSKAEDMMGATRFLVKALDWRSLAFTRNPINSALDGARVFTAKSFMAVMKARFPGDFGDVDKAYNGSNAATQIPVEQVEFILPPRNREELWGHLTYHMKAGRCSIVNPSSGASVHTFREHFMTCCGETEWDADIHALALMQLLKRH